jgi:hypothetical protein
MTAPERIPDLTDFTLPAHWYGRPSIRHTGPFSDVLFATKDDHIGLIVIGLRMEVVYPHTLQYAIMATLAGNRAWATYDGAIPAWALHAHIGALGLMVRAMRVDRSFRESVDAWIHTQRVRRIHT